jgi:4-oxalocrotonate tautomerase
MPFITVEILKGRTLDQRREFAAAVTQAAVEILATAPDKVRIRFLEIDSTELARAGRLVCDEQ